VIVTEISSICSHTARHAHWPCIVFIRAHVAAESPAALKASLHKPFIEFSYIDSFITAQTAYA
jgi:hypothetical protein